MQLHKRPILLVSIGCLGACASTAPKPAASFDTRIASTVDAPDTLQSPSRPAPQHDEVSSVEARRATPFEFTVGGAGVSNEKINAGAASIGGTIGYYVNEVVEFSFRQNGWYADAGPGSSAQWNGASRAALDFHIPLGRFVPYGGGSFGYVYGDSVKETFIAGPEAGLKLYLKQDVFLQAGAEYQFYFDKDQALSTAFDNGQFIYGISLGTRF